MPRVIGDCKKFTEQWYYDETDVKPKSVALSCLEDVTAMPTTSTHWTLVIKDANRLYHQWFPNPPSPLTKISELVKNINLFLKFDRLN
jgi:hypothetical protein